VSFIGAHVSFTGESGKGMARLDGLNAPQTGSVMFRPRGEL
jgi:hypothetical protein